jgi:hypothetical protein
MNRYVLLWMRQARPTLSAESLGGLTGRLAGWVAVLRRWRLLSGVVVGADGPISGGVLVTATDVEAARGLAASCPVDAVVLTMRDADG